MGINQSAAVQSISDGSLTPLGCYQASVNAATDLATAIATSLPAGAHYAFIQPEGADIRYRDDGTSPTTSVGMRVYNGTMFAYYGDLTKIKIIAQSGSATTVNIAFYA